MRNLEWALIILGALCLLVSLAVATILPPFLFQAEGWWRGGVGLLVLAVSLRVMEEKK
jgi:hypothetical protein